MVEQNNRELKRNSNNEPTLNGRIVQLYPFSKPQYIAFSNGYNDRLDFTDEHEIKSNLLLIIESKCSELKADCYEVGEKLVTWNSDPGFGSRCENYPIQFYKTLS